MRFRTKHYGHGSMRVYVAVPGSVSSGSEVPEYSKMLGPEEVAFLDLETEGVELPPPRGYLAVGTSWMEPEFRRKGYGTALYREGVRQAKAAGYRGIASERSARNLAADKFWSRLSRRRSRGAWDVLE